MSAFSRFRRVLDKYPEGFEMTCDAKDSIAGDADAVYLEAFGPLIVPLEVAIENAEEDEDTGCVVLLSYADAVRLLDSIKGEDKDEQTAAEDAPPPSLDMGVQSVP